MKPRPKEKRRYKKRGERDEFVREGGETCEQAETAIFRRV
jgi:hypothetical protein